MSGVKTIPEIFENEIGESIVARTEALGTFKDLGPPDLVQIIKTSTKTNGKEIGTYHFVLGVDTSSSASIAAYVNSLTYSVDEHSGWLIRNPLKLTNSTFCCYNAFLGVDVRVEASIPGGIKSYFIDSTGKHPANTEIWAGAFVSSILRAIHYQDMKVMGLRKVDPLPTEMQETKFLETSSLLFWHGWKSGCESNTQFPNVVNNLLSRGILKYFLEVQRPDINIACLIAECLVRNDEEVQSITLLCKSLLDAQKSSSILACQADYLCRKGKADVAIRLYKESIQYSPADYSIWSKLCHAFIQTGDYSLSLITLNSSPLFLPHETDSIKFPIPPKIKIPVKEKYDFEDLEEKIDPTLKRLQGAYLKGPFLDAYSVLTKILAKMGWDQMLKCRSQVFLMEDEYRSQKFQEPRSPVTADSVDAKAPVEVVVTSDDASLQINKSDIAFQVESEMKSPARVSATSPHSALPNISKKALCERWLDNLFMVLYEDLKIYTIWKAEMNQFQSQNLEYHRSASEWEILGDLSLRLGHNDDAKEAFQRCLEIRYSEKAWLSLMNCYIEEKKISHALNAISKLLVRYQNSYETILCPSRVSKGLFNMIREHGLIKIKNTLVSMNLPSQQNSMFHRYFKYVEDFNCLGHCY